jgi:hypothetical protein
LRVGRFEGWNVERQRRTGIKSVEAEGADRRKTKSRSFATLPSAALRAGRMTPRRKEAKRRDTEGAEKRGTIRRKDGLREEHKED